MLCFRQLLAPWLLLLLGTIQPMCWAWITRTNYPPSRQCNNKAVVSSFNILQLSSIYSGQEPRQQRSRFLWLRGWSRTANTRRWSTTLSDEPTSSATAAATTIASQNDRDQFLQESLENEPLPPIGLKTKERNPFVDNETQQTRNSESSRTTDVSIFPMDLVIGNELVKEALMMACIMSGSKSTSTSISRCSSVLVQGSTGTGKSVLVESVVRLLVATTRPSCRVVHVPASTITEEALLGSMDLEQSVRTGQAKYQPGLLYQAHDQILLVEDIHLISTEALSILMHALSHGRVTVEREGLTRVTYPCRPCLVLATCNPDYQEEDNSYLDKFFAMQIDTTPTSEWSPLDRVQIVQHAEAFEDRNNNDKDHAGLLQQALRAERERQDRLLQGQHRLQENNTTMTRSQRLWLCQVATLLDCPGQTGELAAVQVAQASAAYHQRTAVEQEDLDRAVQLCLLPRARNLPTMVTLDEESKDTQEEEASSPPPPPNSELQPLEGSPPPEVAPPPQQQEEEEQQDLEPEESNPEMQQEEERDLEDTPEDLLPLPEEFYFQTDTSIALDPHLLQQFASQHRTIGKRGGKRKSQLFNIQRGRFVKAIFPKENHQGRLAVGSTLRAAAPHQLARRRRRRGQQQKQQNEKTVKVLVEKDDFRIQQLKRKMGSLVIFLVDSSGSMALNRMSAAKGAAMTLLNEAYKSRDKIALIEFHGQHADVLVPPTKAMALARSRLDSMPCGAKTPLADALVKAVRTGLNAVKVKQDCGKVILILISDCRPNVPLCESEGEPFDPACDKHSIDGMPSRNFMKQEVIALAKEIGALDPFDLLVLDTEDQFVRTGLGEELARVSLGNYHRLSRTDSQSVTRVAQAAARGSK